MDSKSSASRVVIQLSPEYCPQNCPENCPQNCPEYTVEMEPFYYCRDNPDSVNIFLVLKMVPKVVPKYFVLPYALTRFTRLVIELSPENSPESSPQNCPENSPESATAPQLVYTGMLSKYTLRIIFGTILGASSDF